MLRKLAYGTRFLTGVLFDPAGIGLKSVTLALLVANPSWTTAL
jgi:hypothetical protein